MIGELGSVRSSAPSRLIRRTFPSYSSSPYSGSGQAEISSGEHSELVDILHVLFSPIFHDLQADLGRCDRRIHAFQNGVTFGDGESLVDPTGIANTG